MKLSDAVVLVTGSARRLGAATARRLHQDGARVVLHCHQSLAEAQALQQELEAVRADSVALVQGRLQTLSEAQALAQAAMQAFGVLDGLVNNASAYFKTPMAAVDVDSCARLLGSNWLAPMGLVQALAPQLRDGGAIVNLLDARLGRGHREFLAYSAAKAALAQSTADLAVALAPRLRVNAVAPGWIDTALNEAFIESLGDPAAFRKGIGRIHPLRRTGAPEEVARLICWLASDEASFVTGQVYTIDGGRTAQLSLP